VRNSKVLLLPGVADAVMAGGSTGLSGVAADLSSSSAARSAAGGGAGCTAREPLATGPNQTGIGICQFEPIGQPVRHRIAEHQDSGTKAEIRADDSRHQRSAAVQQCLVPTLKLLSARMFRFRRVVSLIVAN
jgi:hypothetical protein